MVHLYWKNAVNFLGGRCTGGHLAAPTALFPPLQMTSWPAYLHGTPATSYR